MKRIEEGKLRLSTAGNVKVILIRLRKPSLYRAQGYGQAI